MQYGNRHITFFGACGTTGTPVVTTCAPTPVPATQQSQQDLFSQAKNFVVTDAKKLETTAIKFVTGFVLGVFLVTLASKFISDNFDFRIAAISNKK